MPKKRLLFRNESLVVSKLTGEDRFTITTFDDDGVTSKYIQINTDDLFDLAEALDDICDRIEDRLAEEAQNDAQHIDTVRSSEPAPDRAG